MYSKKNSIREIVSHIKTFYKKHGRKFPWRNTIDPYAILVSEVMLQQTQTNRVIPKYNSFIQKFPTVSLLASADQAHVLLEWSGLGYNRRGKALHQSSKEIVSKHNGLIPETKEVLCTLPGIGPYTAGAVLSFAYNQKQVFIETNIRTVALYHHPLKGKVSDKEIYPIVESLLNEAVRQGVSPRTFYAAIMDYGAHLKKQGISLNNQSVHYTKQTPFHESRRQTRGLILKTILEQKTLSRSEVHDLSLKHAEEALESLIADGLIVTRGSRYYGGGG